MPDLVLDVGVKTDPIEYRFSFPWLFRILADEGIRHVQLGSFFEVYHLPDAFFIELREQAARHGVAISSLFTAHRELGGFFREEPGFVEVARRSYERYIEVGALLGASSVGSNPGATLRDRMDGKAAGIRRYVEHMKELLGYACRHGVPRLTIEPMSSLAEPPTLPEEIAAMCDELRAHHLANADTTVDLGVCGDVSHGYADAKRRVVHDNLTLFDATLPWLTELHLKNTNAAFESTFGFSDAERKCGIVSVPEVRDRLLANADRLPVREMIGYLEIAGPKLGRDYSDRLLEDGLRASIRHVRDAFRTGAIEPKRSGEPCSGEQALQIAPSIMCADLCRLEDSVRSLEALGADMLHFDLMDARFTPNMPLGLTLLEQLRPRTRLPFDVHLMVTDNDLFVRKLADVGVQYVSVHAESATHLDRTLSLIRSIGAKAGVALNPATPLDALKWVVDKLDFVLVMTVNPGFAGQAIVPSGMRKIAECRAFLDRRRPGIPLQVDGNVSFANIPEMVARGATSLVAGSSSVFHRDGSLIENMQRTREAIAEGLGR